MKDNGILRIQAKTLNDWKLWLNKHHKSEKKVWLILAKQKSKIKSIKMQEAIAGALCYGWVDSRKQTIDKDYYEVYFTPRKANSQWSKANVKLLEKLIQLKEVQPPGLSAFTKRLTNSNLDA